MANTLTVFGLRIGLLSLPPPYELLRIRWFQRHVFRMTLAVMYTHRQYEPNFWPLLLNLKPSSRFH